MITRDAWVGVFVSSLTTKEHLPNVAGHYFFRVLFEASVPCHSSFLHDQLKISPVLAAGSAASLRTQCIEYKLKHNNANVKYDLEKSMVTYCLFERGKKILANICVCLCE